MISPELVTLQEMLDELQRASLEVQSVEDGGLCLVDDQGDVWAYTHEDADYFAAVEVYRYIIKNYLSSECLRKILNMQNQLIVRFHIL